MNQPSIDSSKVKSFAAADRQKVGKFEVLDGGASQRRTRTVGTTSSRLTLSSLSAAEFSGVRLSSIRAICSFASGRTRRVFPDVMAVKGDPSFEDDASEILLNPTLVVEVFPTNSRTSYRAQKLEGFLAIPKLKECLLVSESEMRIEHYAWQNAKQWIYRIYNERDDVISLESINCKLSISEIYAQVNLK